MKAQSLLLIVLVGVLHPAAAPGQDRPLRRDALLGLARTERTAGRLAAAADLFRQADALEHFAAPLLAEFFWTVADADPRQAAEVGRRVLAVTPADAGVRDKLIDLASRSGDEPRVAELATEGIRVSPRSAIWHRRLGESRLRQQRPSEAAAAFARAAALPDGTPADRAQTAAALEAAGSVADGYAAWSRIDEAVWSSRPEWAASRLRAIAAAAAPLAAAKAVSQYLVRVPADEQARGLLVELYAKARRPALALDALAPILAGKARSRWLRRESELADQAGDADRAIRALEDLSRAGLASDDDDARRARLLAAKGDEGRLDLVLRQIERRAGECSTAHLEALDTLTDPARLIGAVQARRSSCPDQPRWLERAIDRAVAAGRHAPALAMTETLLAGGGASVEQRELHGLLLLWTKQYARAVAVLEEVSRAAPDRTAAADALIDALRADNKPEEAWLRVERALAHGSPDHAARIRWAQLGLDAHRAADVLTLLEMEPATDEETRAIQSIRGQALAQLGRFEQARPLLESVVEHTPRPEDVLALVECIEATSGTAAALRAAARWDSAGSDWTEVSARLAVLDARAGNETRARQRLDAVARADPGRAVLLTGEIELASRRPARAIEALAPFVREHPLDTRAADLYATALAESGDLDRALDLSARLRARRPDDVAWTIREADWELRRSPSPERLAAVERLAAEHPQRTDARLALAAARARDTLWDAALSALKLEARPAAALGEPELDIASASLMALGRTDQALALLDGRVIASHSLALRRVELVMLRDGVAAVDREFSQLAAREEADAAVYLAWARASESRPQAERILADGLARFPADAFLIEQLAVERWAQGHVQGAQEAAARALAQNPSLVRASIVSIESLRRTGSDAAVLEGLDRFEARVGHDPAALLEVADRLGGYSRSADDPIVHRLIEWTDRVAAEDRWSTRAGLTRARLLAAVGSWHEALDAVAVVAAQSPALPAALKLRAELLSYAGAHAEAIAAYDAYLAVAPNDLAARRQQARVEGWRQAYDAARARYRETVRLFPEDRVIRAEAQAKAAYFAERWRQAISAYRDWLSLEPADSEGRFELAQAYEQTRQYGRAREAYAALLAQVPPHRQASIAYDRLRARRATRVSFLTETQSAAGYGTERLLDQADSLAQLSGGAGWRGTWSFAAGPSRVGDAGGSYGGLRVAGRFEGSIAPAWRFEAALAAHQYTKLDSFFAGTDVSVIWQPADRWRLEGGIARRALLDNLRTVAAGLASTGPRAAASYRASPDVTLDASVAEGRLSDGNRRVDARLSAAKRLVRGRNEVRALATVEGLRYRESRGGYFSPANFWKESLGLVWRGWLQPPQYSGDRERFVESTYLAGLDSNQVLYHSGSVGVVYEFASGVSLSGSGTITRSAVYTSSGVMFALRLRPFATPH